MSKKKKLQRLSCISFLFKTPWSETYIYMKVSLKFTRNSCIMASFNGYSSPLNDISCFIYRTVSSTMWPIFSEFLIFCWFWQNMKTDENIGNITAQKMKFSIKDFFSKCDQMFPADLAIFTEKILNRKLFLWSDYSTLTLLTHFMSIFYFYTPWKYQKTKGFLTFSKGYRNQTLEWNGYKEKLC